LPAAERRVPPAPALTPAADLTPDEPLGMVTVTRVSSTYPTAGVKTAASPWTVHLPAIRGERAGIGELAAIGAENCTRIGRVPLTPLAPPAGVMESSCSAAAGLCDRAGVTRLDVVARLTDATADAWLPGAANATIMMPAPKTSAAPQAVRPAARFFLPGAGEDEVSLVASNGCCLRNHPDRDTAPSPRRNSAFGHP
jgi:hypothetical protein